MGVACLPNFQREMPAGSYEYVARQTHGVLPFQAIVTWETPGLKFCRGPFWQSCAILEVEDSLNNIINPRVPEGLVRPRTAWIRSNSAFFCGLVRPRYAATRPRSYPNSIGIQRFLHGLVRLHHAATRPCSCPNSVGFQRLLRGLARLWSASNCYE